MKKSKFLSLSKLIPCFIILIVIFLTIGFSTFQSNFEVGELGAYVRIEKDIRITGFSVKSATSGGISEWEEFNYNKILTRISLPNSDSTVTYRVQITNLGNIEAGISNISGLPENITYSLSNYTLNSTLCDDLNNTLCKLGSVSTFDITFGYDTNGYDPNHTEYILASDFTFYYVDSTARIGNKYYASLDEAINDVLPSDGKTTIVLLKNTSEVLTINEGQDIVLDLQNYTISNSETHNVFNNYGTLTITNGTITTDTSQGAINNYGTMYMSGGRILSTGSKQAIYNDGGVLEISGTAYLRNTSGNRAAVHNKNKKGIINITGGTIVATKYFAVENEAGTLTIGVQGGGLNTTTPVIQSDAYVLKATTKINFYDGILKGKTGISTSDSPFKNIETGYRPHYSTEFINGVMYNNCILADIWILTFDPNGGSVSKTSKTILKNTPVGDLPIPTRENYVFDGWYTAIDGGTRIKPNSVINADTPLYAHWTHVDDVYIASIGDTEYRTLASAITAAEANTQTTIKLIRDTSENVTISSSKNIIFDFDDCTLYNNSADAVITNNGTLTIISGTITSNSATTSIINNTATLSISGGNILATGLRQSVYNDGGTVNISGTAYLNAIAPERATVQNHTTASKINILGGTITSTNYSAVYNEYGKITIGTKEGTINTTTPILQGAIYGFSNNNINSNVSNIYDGIFKGKTDAISGTISDKEENSSFVNTTEVINGDTYNVSYLQ